ncbi:MAG: hypothetical protein AB3N14_11605 [Flavobacteriaceae bacterium]
MDNNGSLRMSSLLENLSLAAANARKLFRNAIHPIYGTTNQGRPDHIGSSVGIVYKNQRCLLTAAHIIDEAEKTDLHIGKRELIGITQSFQITPKHKGRREGDHYDFAISKVTEDLAMRMGEGAFLSEDHLAEDEPAHAYAFVGYPNSKNKKIDHQSRRVTPVLCMYTGTPSVSELILKKHNISGNDHIMVKHDGKKGIDSEGKRINTFGIRGMSGGAAISLGQLAKPERLFSDQVPAPKLSGIIIEHHKREKVLLATKLSTILNATVHS